MRDSSVRMVRMYSARRGLDAHEQLGAVHERDLVGEARQPVDAVDERRDLRVRAELGELFVAAVHVADDGVGRDDALAVEADDEPQRAVRGRMLRAEVEDHVAGVELDVHLRVGQVTPRLPVDGEVDAHDSSWAASAAHRRRSAPPTRRRPRRHPGRRPAPPRRAWPPRRRGPATASRSGRGAGSPCAVGDPRTRRGGRDAAGSGARRRRRRTSPSTRARASPPLGRSPPMTRRAGRARRRRS